MCPPPVPAGNPTMPGLPQAMPPYTSALARAVPFVAMGADAAGLGQSGRLSVKPGARVRIFNSLCYCQSIVATRCTLE